MGKSLVSCFFETQCIYTLLLFMFFLRRVRIDLLDTHFIFKQANELISLMYYNVYLHKMTLRRYSVLTNALFPSETQ